MSTPTGAPFGWAILGTGPVSRKFLLGLRALGGTARVNVVASRSPENATRFAADLGVARTTATYADAAGAADVDAVYIATPPSEHEAHALLAIAAGKPVLIEKPFALDAAAARRIVKAAREGGVFCMEAMWTRFLPLLDNIRRRIAQGDLGEIRSFHGSFFGANRPDIGTSLFDPARGGGALMYRGIYPLSLARHLLGPVTDLQAMARFGETGVDEDCVLTLRHASGALSSLRAGLRSGGENNATIHGTKAVLKIATPIYRPFAATLTPVRIAPRGPGSPQRFEALREGTLAHMAYQHAGGLLQALRGRSTKLKAAYRGNGYHHEAEAVRHAVAAGALESPVMPLSESIEIMELVDAARSQWEIMR
jgi:predicted dehydrogenase